MNEKNLKPFTKQNAKANGAKGGRASGESKRERKRIKELIAELMEQDAPATDTMFTDYKLDFYTNAAIIAMKLIDRAKSGDVKALRLLLEIVGELERGNRVTVNTNIDNIEESSAVVENNIVVSDTNITIADDAIAQTQSSVKIGRAHV